MRHPPSAPPQTRDRGPPSKEDTQTDFNKMDIFTNTPPPTTAIEACHADGFVLNSGLRIQNSAVLLVGGEAFRWSPPGGGSDGDVVKGAGVAGNGARHMFNGKGQLDLAQGEAWGLLDVVWPKPDLLILGTGSRIAPISPGTRSLLSNLGIRVEVQDTRNAAAQFNLLATERGVQQVAAALIPIGWGRG